jgi:magnesium-transporting ATPase (P-type)
MITGDNPLTAVHVAREVEIVDRDVLILDVKEGSTDESGSFIFSLYSLLSSVMKLTCYPFIDST